MSQASRLNNKRAAIKAALFRLLTKSLPFGGDFVYLID
jgi:hypothetical protein